MFDTKTTNENTQKSFVYTPTKNIENKTMSLHESILEALKISTPAWPLQNTVAVNPFWNLRQQKFDSISSNLCAIAHQPAFMPLKYFLKQYEAGLIDSKSIQNAIESNLKNFPNSPKTIDELIKSSKIEEESYQKFYSFVEFFDKKLGTDFQNFIINDFGKYAASYLDEQQSLAKFPWKHLGFLEAWLEAQTFDRSFAKQGVKDFKNYVSMFKGKNSQEIFAEFKTILDFEKNEDLQILLQRNSLHCLGWLSQFSYQHWQASLDHPYKKEAKIEDALAVRTLYEVFVILHSEQNYPDLFEEWKIYVSAFLDQHQNYAIGFPLHLTWQNAMEQSYQNRIANSIQKNKLKNPQTAMDYQLAFCIDVRSEMIRRHIENQNSKIATIGFAGFFGLAAKYKKIDEKEFGLRCPVLLKPALSSCEHDHESKKARNEIHKITDKLALSYFKIMRKAPLASFLFVEIFGLLTLKKMLQRFLESISQKKNYQQTPLRFASEQLGPDSLSLKNPDGSLINLDQKVERAAGVLTHMGLTKNFAPIVVIAGHGSQTVNNAFGSALDCGACGGHAGDINARILAGLLNEQEVRRGLQTKGISIPVGTQFVAAVHETVSDEVYILDENKIPDHAKQKVNQLKTFLNKASERTRKERQYTRSRYLAENAYQRANNWSEIRPEWALAGNACFIVAPRSRSKGVNLHSRSFLHDYDWKQDVGFKTLELIMTAPMVVTNWINMQYYASTVLPNIYGSGNKILHNLINECGVIEGNSGDLRVGLPIQSVHDGEEFVHEPMRLSVFIEAPEEAIEDIICKHEVVKSLVDNEWLHLLRIDSENQQILARKPGGLYRPLSLKDLNT